MKSNLKYILQMPNIQSILRIVLGKMAIGFPRHGLFGNLKKIIVASQDFSGSLHFFFVSLLQPFVLQRFTFLFYSIFIN
jgi:hypothetical protein